MTFVDFVEKVLFSWMMSMILPVAMMIFFSDFYVYLRALHKKGFHADSEKNPDHLSRYLAGKMMAMARFLGFGYLPEPTVYQTFLFLPVTFSFFMALPFGNMLESGLLDKLIESPPDFCLISLAIIIGTFWLAVRITPKVVNLMEQGETK